MLKTENMVFPLPIFSIIFPPSKPYIHDLGKTGISIFNIVTVGLCVGQFVYPDENRAKEFQSRSGGSFTHFTGFAGFAPIVDPQFEKPSEKRSEKPVDRGFHR